MTEPKTYYRIAPRPKYDTQRTEAWLEHMAREGLFLTKDGFFAGFGFFHKKTPKKVRYRLCYSTKPSDERPDDEQLELMEATGWNYAAARGRFDIFMTEDREAPEPSTDPEVDALLYKRIKNDALSHVFHVAFWTLLYPIIYSGFHPIMSAVSLGTPLTAFIGLLFLWWYVSVICEAVYHVKIYKQLKGGEPRRSIKWKEGFDFRSYLPYINAVLVVFAVVLLLAAWKNDTENEMDYAEYTGKLPFADLGEIMGGEYDVGSGYLDTIKVKSDILAPTIIDLHLSGSVVRQDGTRVSGGISVNYYEMASYELAVEVAKEYASYDYRHEKRYYKELEAPDIGADYIAAYNAIFPTVCMVKGNKVIHAYFYATTEAGEMTMEQWARALYNSM